MTKQIFTFTFPDIGEGVVEGEIIQWLKKIGDEVKKDEAVVTVMTDKATVELPSPYPGALLKQYYKEGEVAIKDRPLFDIELQAGIQLPKKSTSEPFKKEINLKEPNKKIQKKNLTDHNQAVLAPPNLRKLAKDLGIDLRNINPSGNHGQITLEDLKGYSNCQNLKETLNQTLLPLEGDESKKLTGIAGLMAKKMGKVHIPQFSYFEDVDVTRLIQLRNNSNKIAKDQGINLSYMPFLIRALQLTICEYPLMNTSLDVQSDSLVFHKKINVSIAMATPNGLIVPVMKDVEKMNLTDIINAYQALKIRAKEGSLNSSDMKEGTITLSNFGSLGNGKWATPMIMPPEVCILAVSKITKTPAVKDDQIVILDTLNLSFSFDHRVLDGQDAAKISDCFCKLIKDPLKLL